MIKWLRFNTAALLAGSLCVDKLLVLKAGIPVHFGLETKPNFSKHDLLVVAPHPDDETLACFGVITQARAQGKRVAVVFLTSGERYRATWQKKELARTRVREAQGVLRWLGFHEDDFAFLGYPDGYLMSLWQRGEVVSVSGCSHQAFLGRERFLKERIVDELRLILEMARPEVVYFPHSQDSHPDHKATHYLVKAAISSMANSQSVRLMSYLTHFLHSQDRAVPSAFRHEGDWLKAAEPPGLSGTRVEGLTLEEQLSLGGEKITRGQAKERALRMYASQYEAEYMAWFAQKREYFWQE